MNCVTEPVYVSGEVIVKGPIVIKIVFAHLLLRSGEIVGIISQLSGELRGKDSRI